jgi:DNA invertase Pin-like site-specific DNA recombinase
MKIGIYTRKEDLKLPTIKWLAENGFDSFKIFEDEIIDEFGDISERSGLNQLFFSAEASSLDAVYVADLKTISNVSIKILQVLMLLQELNLPLFHEYGCIQSSDKMVKKIHDQMVDEWMRIQKETKQINFFN